MGLRLRHHLHQQLGRNAGPIDSDLACGNDHANARLGDLLVGDRISTAHYSTEGRFNLGSFALSLGGMRPAVGAATFGIDRTAPVASQALQLVASTRNLLYPFSFPHIFYGTDLDLTTVLTRCAWVRLACPPGCRDRGRGPLENALYVDGGIAMAAVPSDPDFDLLGDFTVEFWVSTENIDADMNRQLIGSGNVAPQWRVYLHGDACRRG